MIQCFTINLTDLGQRFYTTTTQRTQWWGSPDHTEPKSTPCLTASHLWQAQDNEGKHCMVGSRWGWALLDTWEKSLYCTSPRWSGVCMLETIYSSFSLLPLARKEIWENSIQSQGDPKEMMGLTNWEAIPYPTNYQRNDPILWPSHLTEDVSWGILHSHVYIELYFRLQAVVEIIIKHTSKALNILAKQQTKMPNAIYKNCLALNYFLATDVGRGRRVYGKFNLSNCGLK